MHLNLNLIVIFLIYSQFIHITNLILMNMAVIFIKYQLLSNNKLFFNQSK